MSAPMRPFPTGLSIVVPVYNEGENAVELAERLDRVVSKAGCRPCEIVFADDSTDETTFLLERLAAVSGRPCRVRTFHRRERGLATAVVSALRRAEYPYVVVMDGDLQHPPEVVPELLERLRAGADLVVASRSAPGGADRASSLFRRACSRGACAFARLLLPSLPPVRDLTAGFFAFRREIVERVELRPLGWKILIEVLARARPSRVEEVPYVFEARRRGRSRFSSREALLYVRHILRLRRECPS